MQQFPYSIETNVIRLLVGVSVISIPGYAVHVFVPEPRSAASDNIISKTEFNGIYTAVS